MPARTDGKPSGGNTATLTAFKTTIDIPADAREQLCQLLNQQLADTVDLYTQLKHAHWNVKGHDFYQLHLLFDQLAECPEEWSDKIAERVATLGGYVTGTARMAAASTRLPEVPNGAVEGMELVRAMVASYANYCASTRECIGRSEELSDPTTANMLTDISEDADKNRWFLEAHLQA
jgi:starvation-inducible DNA-binding protein